MHPLELTARQMEWAASNLAFNLDFVPDDKLDWKPAPHAPSALEIVEHLLQVLDRMTPLLRGEPMGAGAAETLTERETAKSVLILAARQYSAAMRAIPIEDLDNPVETRLGTLPLRTLATMPVMDVIHHHGQIAYIQLLLGDTETHRDVSLFV